MEPCRIAVTGANGFIGANLIRKLVETGNTVYALVRPDANLWRLEDLKDRIHLVSYSLENFIDLQDRMQEIRPQVLYHSAFPPGHPTADHDQQEMLQIATIGTSNLLKAAQRSGVDFVVNIGSSTEYGASDRPLREDMPLKPSTIRGFAKAAQHLACIYHARSSGQRIVTLRLFSIYGPWENGNRLIPTLALAALRGVPVRLTTPGFRHDFLYIEDAVEALLMARNASLLPGDAINIGSGVQVSNEQVVEVFQKVSGVRLEVKVGEYPSKSSDVPHWQADIHRAQDLLGWKPRFSLEQGLRKNYEWFSQFESCYRA